MTKLSEKPQKQPNYDLLKAALNGDTDACLALIAQGADMNAHGDDGWTALMVAAIHGYSKLGLDLIAQGADVNVQNKLGGTALTLAERNWRFDFLRKLHEHGVDISSVEDLILAQEAKEQAKIQEAFQKAIANLGATDLGQLAADFRKAQTQTNEPEALPLPAVATVPIVRSLDNS